MVHCRIYGILKVMRRCKAVADSGEILFFRCTIEACRLIPGFVFAAPVVSMTVF